MLNKAIFCKGLRSIATAMTAGWMRESPESQEYVAGVAEGYEFVADAVEDTSDVWEVLEMVTGQIAIAGRQMDGEYMFSVNHRGEGKVDGMQSARDILSKALY